MPRCLFLTGATGLVGGYLLARLAVDPALDIHVLVRPNAEASPRQRLDLLGAYFALPDLADRVTIHAGDLTDASLGLGPAAREVLRHRVTDVVHAAASLSFTDAATNRLVNCDGTRRLLAALSPSARFFHISTAYVGGRAAAFREDQLDVGQEFRNAYESSKFEAEGMVRRAFATRPDLLTVLRPSIVVGEQRDGRTFQFLTVYAVLRLLATFARRHPAGTFALQFDPDGTQNYIPVDRLTDMLEEVWRDPRRWGTTYHLVNDAPVTNHAFRDLLEQRLGIRLINCRPDARFTPLNRAAVMAAEPYLAYLLGEPRFGCRARRTLASAQAPMPFDQGYLDRLLGHCERTAWGKKLAIRR